ncbi:uncharacterized protein [Procambarus clarkii]|uniref:uncharacterized protein isoform X1 n=1 Tax=Procambarus clarkii TaxID=6728 RepID=UPI001E677B42|nr:uncharacterized protein LOC123753681 [Procambarus clarkii]
MIIVWVSSQQPGLKNLMMKPYCAGGLGAGIQLVPKSMKSQTRQTGECMSYQQSYQQPMILTLQKQRCLAAEDTSNKKLKAIWAILNNEKGNHASNMKQRIPRITNISIDKLQQ